MDRRKFIKSLSLGCAALAGTTAGITAVSSGIKTCTEDLEVTQTKAYIRNLPAEFLNYRIGFISDQHLSTSVSEEFIDHSFKSLANAGIDLLILGGDYVYNPDDFIDRLFDVVRTPRLKNITAVERSFEVFRTIARIANSVKPKDGVFAVYGNHDRWDHPLALEKSFAGQQIPLMKNTSHFIARGNASIRLIGVDDYLTGTPFMPAFERMPNQAVVLVSHNPDFMESVLIASAANASPVDLVLCGHTHGGQIKLPVIGAAKNIYMKEYFQGLVQKDGINVYTSRGIGTVFVPYRIGARPEATIIELV